VNGKPSIYITILLLVFVEVNLNGHIIRSKIIMFENLFPVTLPTIKFLLVNFINTYLNTSDLNIIKNQFHRYNYLLF